MKLSVIVPVYRAEEYLNECVDSILAQTMDDLELILVNDGSPDKSGDIMAAYARRYPDKIRTITLDNGGQGRARNHGIDAARGEYLSFIDSDDYIAPDMYERLFAAIEKNNADIAICDMEKRFPDGRCEYVNSALSDNPLAAAGSSCDKIFRRSLVGDIRYPTGLWYEDFAFSAKLLMKSRKTVFVKAPLYIYRCGQASTMNNNNTRKNLDIISIMEDIRAFAEANGYLDAFDYLLINHVLLESIKRVAAQNTPEKGEIIDTLRGYVKKYIPSLKDNAAFRAEPRGRKTVMWLNYHGMEKLSMSLLGLKNKM